MRDGRAMNRVRTCVAATRVLAFGTTLVLSMSLAGCATAGLTLPMPVPVPAILEPLPETQPEMIEPEMTDLERVLYKGLKYHAPAVDVTKFGFTSDDVPNIYHFIKQYPELDYGPDFSATMHSVEGVITQFSFTYPTDVEDRVRQLEQAVDQAVQEVRTSLRPKATQAETVSVISDYLATHVAYSFMPDGVTADLSYATAYSALVETKGVCAAYADAFTLLARKFGLDVITVSGPAETPEGSVSHAWNLVKVDDQWYHVDTTWNDPIPDEPGRAGHSYLLVSDAAIMTYRGLSRNLHGSWNAEWLARVGRELPACTSDKYDDAFWLYVSEPISYLAQTFDQQNKAFQAETLDNRIQYAYKTGEEVVVLQFGLTSDQVRAAWDRWYPIAPWSSSPHPARTSPTPSNARNPTTATTPVEDNRTVHKLECT